jgi:hypothetical protein
MRSSTFFMIVEFNAGLDSLFPDVQGVLDGVEADDIGDDSLGEPVGELDERLNSRPEVPATGVETPDQRPVPHHQISVETATVELERTRPREPEQGGHAVWLEGVDGLKGVFRVARRLIDELHRPDGRR